MSVISSKRTESSMEFIATARKLTIATIRFTVNHVPKRFTFYVGEKLVSLAQDVYDNAKCANSVYATNKQECMLRTEYFIKAKCSLQALISELEMAQEIICFPPEKMKPILQECYKENELLHGCIKKSRAEIKKFSE